MPKYEPYVPTSNEKVLAAMLRAGKRIQAMDQADHEGGFAAPTDCVPDAQMRTIICALVAAIAGDDWECVEDALAMCIMAEVPMRQLADKLNIKMKSERN